MDGVLDSMRKTMCSCKRCQCPWYCWIVDLMGRGGQGGGAMVVQHGGYSHLEKPLLFTGQICQKENLKIKISNMK